MNDAQCVVLFAMAFYGYVIVTLHFNCILTLGDSVVFSLTE